MYEVYVKYREEILSEIGVKYGDEEFFPLK